MHKQSVSNSIVKKLNLNTVFSYVYAQGPVSVRDISSSLNMSVPTVTQNLKALNERNLIVPEGTSDSTGGRKARIYGVNTRAQSAIGLDITRHDISLVILNLMGEAIFQIKVDREFNDTRAYYQSIGLLVEKAVQKAHVVPESIAGVGISLPAIVSADNAYTTNSDPLDSKVVHASDFTAFIPYPCLLFNDANAGGYAEFWSDHPTDGTPKQKSLVYLSVSKTVGGSLMINGSMYLGDEQHCAEFGHMTLVPEGRACYCGQRGCTYAYINTRILSDACGGDLGAFFSALSSGMNESIERIWDEYLYYLALTINNLRSAYDCEIIIGGYLGRYMQPHLAALRKRLAACNIFEHTGDYVRVCSQPLEISAIGAALTFLHHFMRGI
ncbi:MAG: ROK family transcriptional regulator [Clostridia bacterium]